MARVGVLLFLFACVEPTELRRSLPPTLVEQPLSAADQQASVPSGWRLGQTWMLKEYCSAGAIRSRRQLSGFRTDWPAYWHFEIVGEAPDAFVLSRTLLEHPDSGLYQAGPQRPEYFLYRRRPFGLADNARRETPDASLASVSKPWALGPCMYAKREDPWCGPPMPATPPEDEGAVSNWLTRQVALPVEGGTRFLYWRDEVGPSALTWRDGEPYWEDSMGCARLVRQLDGSVHHPVDTADLGDAEPVIVHAAHDSSKASPARPSFTPAQTSIVSPSWKVGDTWVTRHRCPRLPRTYARGGAWVFGWPPPPGAQRSTFALYEVIAETDDAYAIREVKATQEGLRVVAETRLPRFDLSTMTHLFRKRPFGIVHWQSGRQMGEYRGGPCLNTGPAVDRCPFVMPADGPADGSLPDTWVASQIVHRGTDGVELEYRARDGRHLSIRWRDGEPWPEATPSCTKLVRNPDGTVLRPGPDFLDAWEASEELRVEMEETKDPPVRRPVSSE